MQDIQALLEKIKVHNEKVRTFVAAAEACIATAKALEDEGHKAGILKKRLRAMIAQVEVRAVILEGAIFPEKPDATILSAPSNEGKKNVVRHDSDCPYLLPVNPGPCKGCGAA